MEMYTITNNVSDKVAVLNLAAALGFTDTEILNKLKDEGWKGRVYRDGIGTYNDFVITGVVAKGIKPPKRKFTNLTVMQPDEELKNINVPRNIPITFVKSNTEIDRKMAELTEVYVVFYDVEIVDEHVFVGIKIKDYETFQISPLEFYEFVKGVISKTEKKILLVAYNDSFDSNVLIRMHNFYRKYKFLDCHTANRICGSVLKDSDILNTFGRTKKITGAELAYLRKVHGLVDDVRYNYLSQILDVCTYDLFTEGFGGRGSLKYHGIKNGFEWTDTIESNIYAYNKSDVDNMAGLFLLKDILDPCMLYFGLLSDHGKRSHFSVGLNLAVMTTTKAILGTKFVNPDVKNTGFIKTFATNILHGTGIVEDTKNKRLYWENQSIILKGGVGGVHSERKKVTKISDDNIQLFDIDFESFYPNILVSDSCPILTIKAKNILKSRISERIKIKTANPKSPLALKLKIFLNSIYGSLNIENRGGYPELTSVVTALAKKHIVKAVTMLEESVENLEIVDVNTDGILFAGAKNTQIDDLIEDIVAETGINMTAARIDRIYYSSANNYLAATKVDGKMEVKTKGSWLSTTNAPYLSNGSSYNIINLTDVVTKYLLEDKIINCKILKTTKVSEIEKTFEILETPDLLLKNDFTMATSVVTKPCESTSGLAFDAALFSQSLINLKCEQIGVTK